MAKRSLTIPSHTYEPTDDKNLLRFVDREGDWTHYWIKSKKIFVPAVNHIIKVGYPKGERFYNYLLNATREIAERKLLTAGEEGSRTHDAIRDLIRGESVTLHSRYFNELSERYEPLSIEEWYNIEAFFNWVQRYQPQVLIHEHSLWSEKYKFAGTLDFIGSILIPEGDKLFPKKKWNTRILILLDWKTSSGIWDDYELQIAAYRKATLESFTHKSLLSEYKNMWTGIVRLGTGHKSSFEMKVWNEHESEANFKLFESVLEIYKKKTGETEDFTPEIRNIPAEFSIQIPKLRIRRNKQQPKGKPQPQEKESSKKYQEQHVPEAKAVHGNKKSNPAP
jgi:hypothetical protein